MATHKFVVIAGCGRLGALIANRLSGSGESVVVIDREESAFSSLSPDYSGFKVEGDATEIEVLRRAKVENADIVIATTREDNVNILISLLSRHVGGVPRVLARISNIRRQSFYTDQGIEAVSPTAVVADHLLAQVGGNSKT